MIEPKIFTVGQINRYIRTLLENEFILSSLLVKGEISNFKAHSSGHLYFTLKDASGALSCVMFRQDAAGLPFEPENGMQVVVYGHISLYEKTGQYQLYAEFMEPLGIGALQVAFEQLKEKLAAEGLFDGDRRMSSFWDAAAAPWRMCGASMTKMWQEPFLRQRFL